MASGSRSFNTYSTFSEISYNIISYLMDNNEVIWKLLYYNDPDAWKSDDDHPNLTRDEKRNLIYDGQNLDENAHKVFLDGGQDESFKKEVTILRIYPAELYPTNYVWGHVTIAVEIYSHYLINTMSNHQTRIDRIIQELLGVLNGAEIENLGQLYFDRSPYGIGKVRPIGQIPFKGKGLTLCNNVLG